MASIKERIGKDGRVTFKITVSLGRENGKQKLVFNQWTPDANMTLAKARKEARRIALDWEKSVKEGNEPVKEITLAHLANEIWWKNFVENGEHKSTTIDMYRHLLKRVIDRLGPMEVSKIRPIDIDAFFAYLRKESTNGHTGKPLSQATIKHYYNLLRNMFGYAEDKDLIHKNPMKKVDAPKVAKKEADHLEQAQAV